MKKATKLLTTAAVTALTLTTVTRTAFADTNATVRPTPVTTNEATNLRVSLNNLLGQHAVLAILAMEKGYDGSADSTWNGNTWGLWTNTSVNTNASFAGGPKSITINGKSVGHFTGMALVDPYSHQPTQFMSMGDVANVLKDLGIQYQWGGTTLDVQ